MANNQHARNSLSVSLRAMLKGSALSAAAMSFGHAGSAFAANLAVIMAS